METTGGIRRKHCILSEFGLLISMCSSTRPALARWTLVRDAFLVIVVFRVGLYNHAPLVSYVNDPSVKLILS